MLETDARRFTPQSPAATEPRDVLERAERAEAAEHRERIRRLEAEATAADLAQMIVTEVDARREAERTAADLAALVAQLVGDANART